MTDRIEITKMDPIVREGLEVLRRSGANKALRATIQAVAAVADETTEESVAYLIACYQGAKVFAAAGDMDAAITLMNTVPRQVGATRKRVDTIHARHRGRRGNASAWSGRYSGKDRGARP